MAEGLGTGALEPHLRRFVAPLLLPNVVDGVLRQRGRCRPLFLRHSQSVLFSGAGDARPAQRTAGSAESVDMEAGEPMLGQCQAAKVVQRQVLMMQRLQGTATSSDRQSIARQGALAAQPCRPASPLHALECNRHRKSLANAAAHMTASAPCGGAVGLGRCAGSCAWCSAPTRIPTSSSSTATSRLRCRCSDLGGGDTSQMLRSWSIAERRVAESGMTRRSGLVTGSPPAPAGPGRSPAPPVAAEPLGVVSNCSSEW